jgi:hypothetical protein
VSPIAMILTALMTRRLKAADPTMVEGPRSPAGFNLLVISAVSIIAIGDTIKKIDDMGVFITTAVFSVFAYVWMFYCLSINSPGEVDTTEAYLTFGYFFVLLILAFTADKINQKKKKNLEKLKIKKLKMKW